MNPTGTRKSGSPGLGKAKSKSGSAAFFAWRVCWSHEQAQILFRYIFLFTFPNQCAIINMKPNAIQGERGVILNPCGKYDNGSWSAHSLIGEGHTGRVYKIFKEDSGTKLYAALKEISVPRPVIPKFGQRLPTEVSTVEEEELLKKVAFFKKLMSSQYFVSYQDHQVVKEKGEPGSTVYVRMELLESLEMAKSLVDVPKLGIDICGALEILAESQMAHGDIKPSGIFLSQEGGYKLGDFEGFRPVGSELRTEFLGANSYFAPELYRAQKFDYSSELYSLGVIMYQFSNSNRLPFLSATAPNSVNNRVTAFERRYMGESLPPPANASRSLASIILRACAFDKSQRYQSATEMKTALTSFLNGEPIPDFAASGSF
jgi:serine/threonine-protein kinase